MKGLVWFRRDLRIHDNPALSAACKECREIVPLFVFDEPLLRDHVFVEVHVVALGRRRGGDRRNDRSHQQGAAVPTGR